MTTPQVLRERTFNEDEIRSLQNTSIGFHKIWGGRRAIVTSRDGRNEGLIAPGYIQDDGTVGHFQGFGINHTSMEVQVQKSAGISTHIHIGNVIDCEPVLPHHLICQLASGGPEPVVWCMWGYDVIDNCPMVETRWIYDDYEGDREWVGLVNDSRWNQLCAGCDPDKDPWRNGTYE